MATKKLTLVEYDMRRDLAAAAGKLEHLQLPNKTLMEIVSELEEPLYDAVRKDPRWLQKLQDEAMKMARTEIKEIAQRMRAADAKLAGKDKREAEAEERRLDKEFGELCTEAGDVVARKANKLLVDFQGSKKEWRNFKTKTVCKMTVTVITVVPGVAATVASGGTLAPLAIGGAVKATISLSQDFAKLVTSAETIAKVIRREISALRDVLTKAVQKDGAVIMANRSLGVRNTYEIGFNLLSKATSINLGTLKTCEAKIETHTADIEKMRLKLAAKSKAIYALMDEQQKWSKRLKAAERIHTGYLLKRVQNGNAEAEQALDLAVRGLPEYEQRLRFCEKENQIFRTAIKGMKEGMPKWVNYVDDAVSLVVDVGTGVGLTEGHLKRAEAALNAMNQSVSEMTLGSKKPG
jgi:hypothetical protein